jgi:hypothetical protein
VTEDLIPVPPLAEVLFDQHGRRYVPLQPGPDLINVPMSAPELIELWRLHIHAAAWSVNNARPERWRYHEERARILLATAADLDPMKGHRFRTGNADVPHLRLRSRLHGRPDH